MTPRTPRGPTPRRSSFGNHIGLSLAFEWSVFVHPAKFFFRTDMRRLPHDETVLSDKAETVPEDAAPNDNAEDQTS